MDEGLTWLGLTAFEVQVLLAVVDAQEISSVDLAGRLGSSKTVVSRAVQVLRAHGLIDRTPGRRPALVFLDPEAPTALEQLRARARDRIAESEDAFVTAERHLSDAARVRRERGRPFYESSRLRYGIKAHDEVVVHAANPPTRCAARLLVAMPRDLDELCARSWPGTEIRSTDTSLPRLLVLDSDRVGIDYSRADGVRLGWSQDARHVRAAQDLFERWWEGATPGPIKPLRVRHETPLDEWDDFEGLDPDDELFLPDCERPENLSSDDHTW